MNQFLPEFFLSTSGGGGDGKGLVANSVSVSASESLIGRKSSRRSSGDKANLSTPVDAAGGTPFVSEGKKTQSGGGRGHDVKPPASKKFRSST